MADAKSKNLAEYDGPDKVISSHEMHLKLGEQKEGLFNVRCGIPGIDDACQGFQDGELISISGLTKHGKTLLCQSITVGFAKKQQFPLWFSFEVPARQFLEQFPSLPMLYMPSKLKSNAMDWFYDRSDEAYAKYGSRIIFIDHLHYLVDLAKNSNMAIEIGTIIRQLKLFAVDRHFVIFLLCHTRKLALGEELSWACLRDSSFISQESDSVIMVQRTPKLGENTATARIEFHRRTGVMERLVGLQKIGGLLRERIIEDDPEEDQQQKRYNYTRRS
jgi:hypothetical protein